MKILITGADGLLGSHLTRELLKRKHKVSVLIQPGKPCPTLNGLNINLIECDILNYNLLKEKLTDIEAIFHLAANTSLWPSRNKITKDINIKGTGNIIKLSKKLKVKRLIYIGTANSFSYGSKTNPGKEDTEYNGWKYKLDYMDSKYEAQNMVLKEVSNGLNAVVVNPTFMLGAYDSKPSSGAMIMAIYNQKVPACAPGGKNYVNAKDVSIGVANALELGRNGHCYILGNKNLTYKEAFTTIGKVINSKTPKTTLPKMALLVYGFISSLIARVSRKTPTVSYQMAKISCDNHYYKSTKAINELKLPQNSIEEGINDCFNWLKEQQIIK